MKLRDAAFVVDHRRQLSGGVATAHVPRRDTDKTPKKRPHKSQQPNPPPKAPPRPAASQLPSKPAKKPAKKKDKQDTADLLRQDSVKSRNHKLVLAGSTALTVSNNFPSWGAKQKQQQVKQQMAASQAHRAATDALHEEILEYATYTKSTVDAMAVHIEEMITNVRASVLSLWPQSKVETFGSYSTGIWLPSSDVDLVILDVVEKWVESLLVLDTAKVPVLKLRIARARPHQALCGQHARALPAAIVFKQLLRERDLNDAYTGGLSSYSVVLMIIHFSQLWRNGDSCFEAASIYASGSLPPAPSTLAAKSQAQKAGRIQAESPSGSCIGSSESSASPSKAQRSANSPLKKSASLPLSPPTSSYAAIVGRAKQQASMDDSSRETSTEPRFSYAAVAAGIAKVSEKKKPAGPPSSYAAAVSAPAGSSSSAAKRKSVTTPKKQARDSHQLDAVSVSSSSADTEDSSSSCSHFSSTDSDDESAKAQSQPVSLGEHTMMIFEFFGIIFDYHKNGLSVRDGGYIYRLAENHRSHIGKPALVIEDPIHPDRNVSASSFAFSKVVALFEDSYYALKYFRASKFTPSALSCLLSTSGHTSHSSHSHGKVQAVRS
ncbi:hypothetical protein PRIC1_007202 [Phytophthora ramorum]